MQCLSILLLEERSRKRCRLAGDEDDESDKDGPGPSLVTGCDAGDVVVVEEEEQCCWHKRQHVAADETGKSKNDGSGENSLGVGNWQL